jgi:hypothetical protein
MFDYMQKDLRDEKKILMDGSKLLGLLAQNGFADIADRQINVPIGTWDSGIQLKIAIHLTCIGKQEIGAICSDVWTAAMHAFGAQIVPNHFANEQEGNAFLDEIGKELHDSSTELYCMLLFSSIENLTSRYVSYGRKPQG